MTCIRLVDLYLSYASPTSSSSLKGGPIKTALSFQRFLKISELLLFVDLFYELYHFCRQKFFHVVLYNTKHIDIFVIALRMMCNPTDQYFMKKQFTQNLHSFLICLHPIWVIASQKIIFISPSNYS